MRAGLGFHLQSHGGTLSTDLLQRISGRFYTPHWMAERLAKSLLQSYSPSGSTVRVIDPFCGDGRLVATLLNEAKSLRNFERFRWIIDLWDADSADLGYAKNAVLDTAKISGLKVDIRVINWDSFLNAQKAYERYDFVITNPPWEALKPDRREMTGMDSDARRIYRNKLRQYDSELAKALPHSQPSNKLYGWGTNLSRCGMEVSLNLLKHGGTCGIILPSSIFGDQVSAPIREWLLENSNLLTIDHFPAEAKPFGKVDQPCILAVLKKERNVGPTAPIITNHDRNRQRITSSEIRIDRSELREMDYRIPVELNKSEFSLLRTLSRFEPLSIWEQKPKAGELLWMGRELDQTNFQSFIADEGEFYFARGRDVSRYISSISPTIFVKPGERAIPISATHARLVWRDISRRSQLRRMIATIIPAGVVTGNSLNVAYFINDNSKLLHALLAVFNSLLFEFQLRTRLGTGHVSLGSVRGVHIPNLNNKRFVTRLAKLAHEALSGDSTAEIHIEALIADEMGISEHHRDVILEYFGDLPESFKEDLRSTYRSKYKTSFKD